MIRDLVKEEAVARAVRWAEMLPADATAEDKDRAEAILHLQAWATDRLLAVKEAERLEEENGRLKDAIVGLEEELEEQRLACT